MASIKYTGTFGGLNGSSGLTATATGTALPSSAYITGVTYTLSMSSQKYSTSNKWILSKFAVGSTSSGSPVVSSKTAAMTDTGYTFSGSMTYTQADVAKFKSSFTVYAQAYTDHSSTSYMRDFTLTVSYTTRTACTAPTSVTASASNVAPGSTVTLKWSGAKAGTNNAIKGYQVYRATSTTGTYSLLTTVSSTATSGSVSVAAPATNGAAYYYKVLTVGTHSGYNSGQSTAYATVKCSYSSVGAPTSVVLEATNAAPGAAVTLSWSGAKAGTNNTIAGYQVHRATSASGTYSLLTTVSSTATSGSAVVSAPEDNDAAYFYRVLTMGTLDGYNSDLSSAYAALTCTFSSPSAPSTVTLDGSTALYIAPGSGVLLAWSGAAGGANNAITGYSITRDGAVYVDDIDPDTDSYLVEAQAAAGQSYTYAVITHGTYSDSAPSSGVAVYSYTDPTAPAVLTVSNEVPAAGSRVMLSWSGAEPGGYNAITGYTVYRSTTEGGALVQVAALDSTSTAMSCYVTAPSTPGDYYYYRVETIGSYSTSGVSDVYVAVGARAATDDEDVTVEIIVPAPRRRERRGFHFGTYSTAAKGWTLTGWTFPEPETQTTFVDVTGRSAGPLDMTTALTGGDPRHKGRTLTVTLECSDGTRLERDALISEMVNKLHGQREEIIFPDDATRYAVGRLDVKKQYSDMAHAAVTVTATCENWLYSREETRVSLAVIAEASEVVLSNNGRRYIVPEVTVTGYGAQVHLACGGHAWTLSEGVHRLPDLVLCGFSDTVVTYSGIGTLTFTYREAIF